LGVRQLVTTGEILVNAHYSTAHLLSLSFWVITHQGVGSEENKNQPDATSAKAATCPSAEKVIDSAACMVCTATLLIVLAFL